MTAMFAAAMRMADLLPPEDGKKLLAGGLADKSACVGQEARDARRGHRVGGREGDGEDAKVTVKFQRHGMKKLMEKFANLEKI
mgnify:CR=1 FL=1